MRNRASRFFFALALLSLGLHERADSQQGGGIIPADAKLEKVFDDGVVLTEGCASAPDGTIYFSDITFSNASKDKRGFIEAGHIWKFDPKSKKASIFRSPSGMSNGIKFDAEGNMIVAEGADFGGRRVIKTDMKTGKSYILAAMFQGKPLNSPNDITIDEKGRIYFSDPRYLGHEPIEQPVQAVYRIDTDGSLHRIITDAGKPNGVCISPDQKTLYVVSHDNGNWGIERMPKDAPARKGLMALLAYDLAADGTAKFRKILVNYAPQDGPDGLCADVEGNLYVAVRDETKPGIYVYSPAGKELGYIKTEVPTNVGFGRGAEAKTLYITAGKSLYRIGLSKDGYQLPAKKLKVIPNVRGSGFRSERTSDLKQLSLSFSQFCEEFKGAARTHESFLAHIRTFGPIHDAVKEGYYVMNLKARANGKDIVAYERDEDAQGHLCVRANGEVSYVPAMQLKKELP